MLETMKKSLKRLYEAGEITAEQINAMTTLTDEEKAEIMAGGNSGGDTSELQEFYNDVIKEVGV